MAGPIEKRTAERFPVGSNAACVFVSPVLEDFAPVTLVNISLNGVGFISTETLPDNILLAIGPLVHRAPAATDKLHVRHDLVHAGPLRRSGCRGRRPNEGKRG